MLFLPEDQPFPPVENASKDGVLCFSMNLSITRLIEAYQRGIFPWYNANEPVIWWSPNPRMILFPKDLKVSKSMRKVLKSNEFTFTYNQKFSQVIEACRAIPRPGQNGTWITDEVVTYYTHLHHLGMAASVEVHNKENTLVGGLYGIWVNDVFCGESMFAKTSNASKAGFIWFINQFKDVLRLIDCQVYTKHLASLGAKEIPREEFLKYLSK